MYPGVNLGDVTFYTTSVFPYQTPVEAEVKGGKVVAVKVTPAARAKDLVYPNWVAYDLIYFSYPQMDSTQYAKWYDDPVFPLVYFR